MFSKEAQQAHIARNEAVMRVIRDLCRGTPLFIESWFSDMCGSRRSFPLSQTLFQGEGTFDFQAFYQATDRPAIVSPAGDLVQWQTTNRRAYAAMRDQVVRALDGHAISVMEDRSWRWSRVSPLGVPRYVPVYGLSIFFSPSPCSFNAEAFLARATAVCQSADGRADRSLSEVLTEEGCSVSDYSYSWTKQGAIFLVHSEEAISQLKNCFGDCVCVVKEKVSGTPSQRSLEVIFPDSVTATSGPAIGGVVQALKERTGVPLIVCRKALASAMGNIANTLALLRDPSWVSANSRSLV